MLSRTRNQNGHRPRPTLLEVAVLICIFAAVLALLLPALLSMRTTGGWQRNWAATLLRRTCGGIDDGRRPRPTGSDPRMAGGPTDTAGRPTDREQQSSRRGAEPQRIRTRDSELGTRSRTAAANSNRHAEGFPTDECRPRRRAFRESEVKGSGGRRPQATRRSNSESCRHLFAHSLFNDRTSC